MDSPFEVTSAESAVMGIMTSRDVGRDTIFFQGPSESLDIRGEGKGDTSAIALSIGEDMADPGADPIFELLLAKTFLILGVRARVRLGVRKGGAGIREDSLGLRAVLLLDDVVTVLPGIRSVWILSPAFRVVEYPSSESVGKTREEVSRARFECSLGGIKLGGGESAIELDVKIAEVLRV
jgi:hypothetical protein